MRQAQICQSSLWQRLSASALRLPTTITIGNSGKFLQWASTSPGRIVDFTQVSLAHVFSLAGLAAMARQEQKNAKEVRFDMAQPASRFAQSVGFEAAVRGETGFLAHEKDRTVPLQRVSN